MLSSRETHNYPSLNMKHKNMFPPNQAMNSYENTFNTGNYANKQYIHKCSVVEI